MLEYNIMFQYGYEELKRGYDYTRGEEKRGCCMEK
jgi:hypothetical protein